MKILADKVNDKYGAPMGRGEYTLLSSGNTLYSFMDGYTEYMQALRSMPHKFLLQDARVSRDGYDRGGAYWGTGQRVYLAESANGRIFRTFRAADRLDAFRRLREEFRYARVAGIKDDRTDVIFRKFTTGDREVIALFPRLPGTRDPMTCMTYMHMGQHCPTDYLSVIQATRPATPEEYASLKRELERLPDGGYRIKVRKCATSADIRYRIEAGGVK